jgi:Methane oxygenase PmoA
MELSVKPILFVTVLGIFSCATARTQVKIAIEGGRGMVTINGKPFTSLYPGLEVNRPYLYPLVTAARIVLKEWRAHKSGGNQGTLSLASDWVSKDGSTLLTEKRTMTFYAKPEDCRMFDDATCRNLAARTFLIASCRFRPESPCISSTSGVMNVIARPLASQENWSPGDFGILACRKTDAANSSAATIYRITGVVMFASVMPT